MTFQVVVVEDEPQVAELLRLILRHADIEVFVAFDGTSGLALIRQVKPNLIVLDIMMPNMNGWEVYDTVRSDPDIKHIPIIIESVLPERPERRQVFASSEIDHYFTKPFDTTRLRREVGRMLGNDQLWPPPKPRPRRSSVASATGELKTMIEPDKALPPDDRQAADQKNEMDRPPEKQTEKQAEKQTEKQTEKPIPAAAKSPSSPEKPQPPDSINSDMTP